jgi:hypothetical protein
VPQMAHYATTGATPRYPPPVLAAQDRAERLQRAAQPLDEQLSIPVDQDRLGGFGLGLLAGPFDEFAAGEGRSGADQGDEVGCVDGAPAVLR